MKAFDLLGSLLEKGPFIGRFPSLVASNLVVCKFCAEALFCALLRPFAPFCALLRTRVYALLRVSTSDRVSNDRVWELQN